MQFLILRLIISELAIMSLPHLLSHFYTKKNRPWEDQFFQQFLILFYKSTVHTLKKSPTALDRFLNYQPHQHYKFTKKTPLFFHKSQNLTFSFCDYFQQIDARG